MRDLLFAQNRFGLGPRGGQPAETGDGREWVEAQLGQRLAGLDDVPTRSEAAEALIAYREERRDARQNRMDMPAAMPAGGTMASLAPASMMAPAPAANPAGAARRAARPPELAAARRDQRELYLRAVDARVGAALTTPTPFLERMAHFWANHFAVGATKMTTVGYAGLLELEAIRPNLTGSFADLLFAVERHPAMLLYLDQAQSVGPNSLAGERAGLRGRDVGLNENLAREILELHTLGVRTGYSQSDVTEFARALTGWTVAGIGRGPMQRRLSGQSGDFTFAEALHEPGARTILSKRYGEDGEGQARAVLRDLAVHPATARHVATKLARHFIADDPPPAAVARVERAFLTSRGDLPTVYRALIEAPEAWQADRPKFRNPWEWTIASLRALDLPAPPAQRAVGLLQELGMPVWRPASPAGFDDIAASWAGPDALVRRVEAAGRFATAAGQGVDARALAPGVLGARLSNATATAISRAESPATGLALLLVSPEFLRR
ncbi:uncharacterized protein (DUF1800 family) [Sphingomonas kaistensis]|uniref:Uncharacterized protein (DUF1800 family) n=1 Tax=Sphingomonas kaistensis TaxID=298708 RepID=A0A7X6BHZ5_9SPHN|nr:DUF1800 domain-containing protein [Sphingomonas kaistensis]NJC06652.1 uncharacterized protein (DUF1800 family) [Sphingomonas kaistensis]